MRHSIKSWLAPVLAAVVALTGAAAQAQWVPKGPVELIVSAGPGGGNDRTARLVAKVLQDHKLVPVPVIVINKPGAGGVIAQNYLNSHPGDGRYLMVVNPALITNPLAGIGTMTYQDVTPLAQLFTEYVVLITRPGSELRSGREVLERLKANPESLTLGVAPALGAGTHIGIAMAAKAAGIDPAKMRVIPYTTSGDAMTAVMGGHIDLMSSTPINVLPQLENGTVRVLAHTGPKRLGGKLAGVPTFREEGANAEFGNWRGLVGPRGMKPEQLAFWDGVFAKLVATPEWQAEVRSLLSENLYLASAASKTFLDEEHSRLSKLLAELGFKKK